MLYEVITLYEPEVCLYFLSQSGRERRHGEVAFLVLGLVTEVRALFPARVPDALVV